jgi:hypothetical protein
MNRKLTLLTFVCNGRKTGGQNDTDGFGLAAQPDQSQGRPSINTGSQPIYQRAAYPYLVLPEKPLFRYAGRYDHRRTDSRAAPL